MSPNVFFLRAILLLSVFIHSHACRPKTEDRTQQPGDFKGEDHYAEKVKVAYAKGFTIDYFDHFKIVNVISPFDQSQDTTKYLLLDRGTKRPDGYPDSQVIEIPIRSIAAMSSMHVGLLGFLDSYDVITGLGSLQYVYAPEVIKRIRAGKIAEVGKDQGLNEEKLVAIHPDLVMAMGSPGAGMDHYKTLNDAGIPVLINSEWIETTPLARAEWVKLAAALLNKEALVNRKFSEIEKEYNRLAKFAGSSNTKPSVISGLNTKDVWFLPGGQNYMTRFFEDAGAKYHWSKTKSAASLSLGFEAVYPVALDADFWLNVGFDSRDTRKSVMAMDARYSDFKACRSARMYSYNNRVSNTGSNDFFESGNVNPQLVLADLIKILHPELLPAHKLVYYKKLE